jgi:hypothetical protein
LAGKKNNRFVNGYLVEEELTLNILPTARALYLTRQHYGKTVLEGEDNNMFST